MDESDVPGKYVANFFGKDRRAYIVISADSTYVHYYQAEDGQAFADSGRWRFYQCATLMYVVKMPKFVRRYPVRGPCYCSGPEGVIDITAKPKNPYVYKYFGRMYMDFCGRPEQRYVKVDQ